MRIITVLLLSLLITACISGSKKQFQKLYYRFPEPQTISSPIPLTIKKPTALGILANRPLVVVEESGALKQMNYSFWLESPKVLLNNYLYKMFQSQASSEEKYTLLTQILRFEKQQEIAIVEIKFKLINPEERLEFEKTYIQQLQASDKSIGKFVKNIGLLLQQITEDLNTDLQKL